VAGGAVEAGDGAAERVAGERAELGEHDGGEEEKAATALPLDTSGRRGTMVTVHV
jgi:hypothetical protein